MLQYKVPQNVDVEDKIIGPLTIRQFLQSLIGVMIIYILYALLKPISFSLFLAAALPVALFFAALAIYKVNDQPFEKFLFALIQYAKRPNIRIWQKETTISDIKVVKTKAEKEEVEKEEVSKSRLDELAYILDTRGWIEEKEKRRNKENILEEMAEISPAKEKDQTTIPEPPVVEKKTSPSPVEEKVEEKTEKIQIPSPFEDLLPEEPEDMYEYYSNKM